MRTILFIILGIGGLTGIVSGQEEYPISSGYMDIGQLAIQNESGSYPSFVLYSTEMYKRAGVRTVRVTGPDGTLFYRLTMDTSGNILSVIHREQEGMREYTLNNDTHRTPYFLASCVTGPDGRNIRKDTVYTAKEYYQHTDTLLTVHTNTYHYYLSGKYLNDQNTIWNTRQLSLPKGSNKEHYATDFIPDSFYLCQTARESYITGVLSSVMRELPSEVTYGHPFWTDRTPEQQRYSGQWNKLTYSIRPVYQRQFDAFTRKLHPQYEETLCRIGVPVWRPSVRYIYTENREGLRTALCRYTSLDNDTDEDSIPYPGEVLFNYVYEYFDR